MKEKNKIILIEGTDCSGKETQSKLLISALEKEGIYLEYISFPQYETPTGKIIGGPYLGKAHISEGWFPEGAVNVDPKVSALYFAADRRYNMKKIEETLKHKHVLLDRYVESNMGHQGGKIKDRNERIKMFKWLEHLEYELLEFPRPDVKILLYMPYEAGEILRKNRKEALDEHEVSKEHLLCAEEAYLDLAELFNFDIINCAKGNKPRTPEEIHKDVLKLVKEKVLKL
jgi:dTMP kinase